MKISKDAKYLTWCVAGAELFSTCSRRHYMAIIIDREGRVVGTGYNGGPPNVRHCEDGGCPRANSDSPPGGSYDNCIAIHAEENALLWSDRTARLGGTLYVNGIPCYGCAKKIAGSGLARLVCVDEGRHDSSSLAILREAGVEYTITTPLGDGAT